MRFVELLDCVGPDFPREWTQLYVALRDRGRSNSQFGLERARSTLLRWRNQSESGWRTLPEVILGQTTQRSLGGFCPLGYCAAMQRVQQSANNAGFTADSADCLAWQGSWWPWSFLTESRWSIWLDVPTLLGQRQRQRRRRFSATQSGERRCPNRGLYTSSRCWYLSRPGQPCLTTCSQEGLEFSSLATRQSSIRVLPFLVMQPLADTKTAWSPLECYVRQKSALYASTSQTVAGTDPGTWSSRVCELACPCQPPPAAAAGASLWKRHGEGQRLGKGEGEEQARSKDKDEYIQGYRDQLGAALAALLAPAMPSTLPVSTAAASKRRSHRRSLNLAAFGVHLTTLLEPLSAFKRVLPSELRFNVVFYGSSHPPPEIIVSEVCPDSPPGAPPPALRCFFSTWPSQRVWMDLYEGPRLREALDALVEIVDDDPYLQNADCILCGGGHSPTLCLLLRMVVSTPMYFTLQAPLSFRMPQDDDQRALLVALFREMSKPTLTAPSHTTQGRSVVSTSLIFLQRQVWVQTGCLLPIVRNHNLYVEANLAGVVPGTVEPKEVIFWQNHVSLKVDCSIGVWRFLKQLVLDDFPFYLVFKNVKSFPGRHPGRKVYALKEDEAVMLSFRDLRERYAAAVLFPHDVGTISFDDLYALSIPLFLPETKLIASMAYAQLVSTQNYPWYLLRAEHASLRAARADREEPLPWDPGWGGRDALNSSSREMYVGGGPLEIEKVEHAVATANYALFPHIHRFGSLAALLRDLAGVEEGELARTSAAMQRSAAEAWEASAEFYRRVALHLMGVSPTPT